MRMTFEVAIVAALAGCAEGGSATDQAREDHDLGVFNNVKLALTSQVATDRQNTDAILHHAGAEPAATP